MKRDVASGSLLIAGAGAGVVVMLMHPTAHGLMSSEGAHLSRVNALIHGLALVAMPMNFLGLMGLWRRLRPSDVATAGLVSYGWGCVAVMGAAVASGFVAPGVIEHIVAKEGSKIPDAFFLYTGLWNQAFAKVNVVASSLAILLFSVSILRTGRLARAAGVTGAIIGSLILLLFFAGHIGVDIHGFGVVTFAQSAWLVWIGVSLLRGVAYARE